METTSAAPMRKYDDGWNPNKYLSSQCQLKNRGALKRPSGSRWSGCYASCLGKPTDKCYPNYFIHKLYCERYGRRQMIKTTSRILQRIPALLRIACGRTKNAVRFGCSLVLLFKMKCPWIILSENEQCTNALQWIPWTHVYEERKQRCNAATVQQSARRKYARENGGDGGWEVLQNDVAILQHRGYNKSTCAALSFFQGYNWW